jgi:Spy/CpxP family protein refolding chaperone
MAKALPVALALVAAVSHSACGRGGGDRLERLDKMVSWKLDDALDDLDATDAQRKQVEQIKVQLLAEAPKLMADHKKARQELIGEWGSTNPSAERVHAVVDQRMDAFRAVAHKVADAMLQVHALLTPQQRQEINERIAKRHR